MRTMLRVNYLNSPPKARDYFKQSEIFPRLQLTDLTVTFDLF